MVAETPAGTQQKLRAYRQARAGWGLPWSQIIARALRDAGMEVIYTGLHQTPEMVAEAALQEDVDAVGLSILSGAHMAPSSRDGRATRARPRRCTRLRGGIIPRHRPIPAIKEMGIAAVFGPGTPMEEAVRFLR